MDHYIELDRCFWPVPKNIEVDTEKLRMMISSGTINQLLWTDLLKRRRTIILGEPGNGKSSEFKARTTNLRNIGYHAFYFQIVRLADSEFADAIEIGDIAEFADWQKGNQEAYLFLDSIDEARLSNIGDLELGLRNLSREISCKDRAKIFVSSRVAEWRAKADLHLFLRYFPNDAINIAVDQNEAHPTPGKNPAKESTITTKKSDDEQFAFSLRL